MTSPASSSIPQSTAVRRFTMRLKERPLVALTFVYLAMRLVNLAQFALLARTSGRFLSDVLMNWDAHWLLQATTTGWPTAFVLVDPVQQSTWAWPPLVPGLARLASLVPGLDAELALILLNLTGGLVACWFIYLAVRRGLGHSEAMGSALVWLALPASPVLLMGYAEGVFTALVFASLWALGNRRYMLAAVLLVPAGMTKLQVIPFAVTVIVVVTLDAWNSRHQEVRIIRTLLVVSLSIVSMVLWPLVVALELHDLRAYARIQSAWEHSSVPFADTASWFLWLPTHLNRVTLFSFLVLLLSIVAGVVLAIRREVPIAIRVAGLLVPAFFLATGAGVSTVRYLLPDPGIPPFLARMARRRIVAIGLGVLLAASQMAWIVVFAGADSGSMPP